MQKLFLIIASLLWSPAVLLLDFLLRQRDNNIDTGGIETNLLNMLFLAGPVLIGMSVGFALSRKSQVLAYSVGIITAILAYLVSGFVGLYYACGTGIDCI
mgnify:CR=1